MSLKNLKGLGPKSEQSLNKIGIFTKEDLEEIGAVRAYIKLSEQSTIKPSLNFLYAMVGALEDKNWIDIAKTERTRLIFELDDYAELKKFFQSEEIDF